MTTRHNVPGLWDLYRLACYKSCSVSPAERAAKWIHSGLRAMKFLVVLVLAVLSGCNAQADAPKPQLDELTEAFWAYVATATNKAGETLEIIKKTQFGQDMSARLTEGTDMATSYAANLQGQLPTEATELITKLTAEADVLRVRMQEELKNFEPFSEETKTKIQGNIAQFKQEMASYAEMDPETLRTTLTQRSEELKANVQQSVSELTVKLAPIAEDLKKNMDNYLQDFKTNVTPLAEKVQGQMTGGVQQAKEMAAPYVEEIREKLNPYTEDMRTHFMAMYEYFNKGN